MIKGYNSFSDWEYDFNRVKQNPKDKQLLRRIVSKLKVTDKILKEEIEDFIEGNTLLINPMLVLKKALRNHPRCFILVKDLDEVWFEC